MSDRSVDETLDPPVGASVWEKDLFDHLVGHLQREGALLQEYSDAASTSGSKAFAYVVGLLCEDERRHHQLFGALAESLRDEAEPRGGEPPVPHMDFGRGDAGQVRQLTEKLLRSEEQDAHDLKQLRRKLRDVRDTTLWSLLIDTMQRDTEKHVALLEFVLRHTPSA